MLENPETLSRSIERHERTRASTLFAAFSLARFPFHYHVVSARLQFEGVELTWLGEPSSYAITVARKSVRTRERRCASRSPTRGVARRSQTSATTAPARCRVAPLLAAAAGRRRPPSDRTVARPPVRGAPTQSAGAARRRRRLHPIVRIARCPWAPDAGGRGASPGKRDVRWPIRETRPAPPSRASVRGRASAHVRARGRAEVRSQRRFPAGAPSGSVGSQVYDGPMGLAGRRNRAGYRAQPAGRPRERGQGRAAARPLSGAPRRRAVSHRAQPVGRRSRRARPAAALRLPARRRRSARSTTCSAGSSPATPQARPVATDAQRTLIARRAVGRGRPRGHDARSLARPASPASPTRCSARWPSSSRACSTRPTSTATSPSSTPPTARELDRVGFWDRDLLRRRASERHPERARRLARRARLRLRLRGPDRGRVDAARGARRPGRGRRLAAVRAGARGVRVAAAHGRGSRRARERAHARARRRARPSTPRRRSPGSSARCSSRRAATPPPLAGAVSFLEGAGTRGTLELVADEVLELLRDGVPAEQVALVVPTRRPLARAARDRVRDGRHPVRGRRPRRACPRRRSATRCSRCSASPGPAPGARELYALPPLAVLGHRPLERRLRRGPAARPRGRGARAGRGRDRAAARGAARAAAQPARRRHRRSRASARCSPRWSRRRTASTGRRSATPRGSTCAASPRPTRLLDELETWERARRAARAPTDLIAALERLEVSTGDAGEPGRVAVLDLMRARTRRFEVVFVLGLEEGSLPRRGRSSPFLDDDRRRELGARLERPDPVSRDRYLFYTACTRATRRLVLVREAATDEGAPTPGELVLGRRRGRLRPRRRGARDAAARALAADAADRRGADRARAAARARARSRPTATRPTSPPRSPTPTAGRAGCAARGSRSTGRRACATRSRSRASRRARRSARPSSSASSTARRPGCSSGWSTRRRSTPRPTRCCAARSPTRRSTRSTTGCRRSSAPSA